MSLRAAAYGVRVPDGIMAAYPATMLQSAASPSRLLSLMDPLLPLSVLSKCVSAYAGETHTNTLQAGLVCLVAWILQGQGLGYSLRPEEGRTGQGDLRLLPFE